jgi:hypothetical protein
VTSAYKCFHCEKIVKIGEEHRHPVTAPPSIDALIANLERLKQWCRAQDPNATIWLHIDEAIRALPPAAPVDYEEMSIDYGQQVTVTFKDSGDAFALFNELMARAAALDKPQGVGDNGG